MRCSRFTEAQIISILVEQGNRSIDAAFFSSSAHLKLTSLLLSLTTSFIEARIHAAGSSDWY